MTETIIAALIGAGASIAGQSTTLFFSKIKSDSEMKWKEYQVKSENLKEVYEKLISIINLYPNESPNDVLSYIEYAPRYSMEHFDSVIKILDYQIEDYKRQLSSLGDIDYKTKCNIEVQISNSEYAKRKVSEIYEKYYKAKDAYKCFCMFDLFIKRVFRFIIYIFQIYTETPVCVQIW